MAEFRRQPEWQQDANRHSTLIDPVLTVRPIARFDYTVRRSVTAIDHALVFVTAKGSYDVGGGGFEPEAPVVGRRTLEDDERFAPCVALGQRDTNQLRADPLAVPLRVDGERGKAEHTMAHPVVVERDVGDHHVTDDASLVVAADDVDAVHVLPLHGRLELEHRGIAGHHRLRVAEAALRRRAC